VRNGRGKKDREFDMRKERKKNVRGGGGVGVPKKKKKNDPIRGVPSKVKKTRGEFGRGGKKKRGKKQRLNHRPQLRGKDRNQTFSLKRGTSARPKKQREG